MEKSLHCSLILADMVMNRFFVVACVRWVFMYEKGYQAIDIAIGSIFTKMKGVTFTNISGKERIWDAADFVFPEQVGWVS